MSHCRISSDQNCIYLIICHGRSGSTLLRRLLNTHSQIYAPAEPWLFFWYYQSLQRDDYASLAYSNFLGDDKLAAYKDFIHSIIQRKLVGQNKIAFVEKTPRNNEILDFIESIDKNIRYIYLIRDLKAIACSALCRGNSLISEYRYRLTGNYFKSLKQIKNSQLKIDKFVSNLDSDRLFILKYEDLVSCPEKVMQFLFDWMKIKYEDVTIYEKKEKSYSDINTLMYDRPCNLSIDKWKRKLLWLEKLYFERKAGEINRAVISTKTSYDSF